jgi:hypothetical protein
VFASFGSSHFGVAALTVILVLGFHLHLVYPNDIQVQSGYFLATVFKPENIDALVNIQTVLFGVAFEKLGLSDNVILGFFFFLFVDEVSSDLRLSA